MPEVNEVVVNAAITAADTPARTATETQTDARGDKKESQAKHLNNEITRLERELNKLRDSISCMLHGEFEQIKHYVDQAIERDHLIKRP